ncbi:ParB N-terminal domain-containing protein [uncultured Anaerococcus sp.]|uniref:ParB N-terminal domain-containing protein n=1 Tax=uncultured Anaerococcus sp. TaxID=293428 RepID=UPI002803B6A8|nr:ParB N-terminal domain-containing protein [uncultured Anaerococcus sp.]
MLIDIEKVRVGDRIRKDMGDLKELSDDIAKNGLINPPVVTPDFELIAGERRLEAMKKLGYKQVEVRIMKVEDAEHKLNLEINENENRKDFNKSERIEYARQLERIERVKASQREKAGVAIDPRENFPQGRTRDLVAEKLGIGSGKQYEKEKYIADNADPETLEQWNNEEISTHKAYTKVKELEKQLEESTAANKRLADKVIELEQREPEIIEKEVVPEDYEDLKEQQKDLLDIQRNLEEELYQERKNVKEVEPKDYKDLKLKAKEIDKLYEEIKRKNIQIISLQNKEKEALEKLEEYDANKKIINDLRDFMWSIDTFIRRVGGLIYLTDYYKELSKEDKKYFDNSVDRIYDWSGQLKENLKQIKNKEK